MTGDTFGWTAPAGAAWTHHGQAAPPSPPSSHPALSTPPRHRKHSAAHPTALPPQHFPLPRPPPAADGLVRMLPYDRRNSVGGAGSPPYAHGASPFSSRQMPPPPSPPHMPSHASALPGSGPVGPPLASPFAGMRDLAGFSSRRSGGGMSISSMLGGNDDHHQSPPRAAPLHEPTPKSMRPPSPGRARSSSMREDFGRPFRDISPPPGLSREPRPLTAAYGMERTASDQTRRESLFGPPHNFRAFQPSASPMNGYAPPDRPSSQPIEHAPSLPRDDFVRREPARDIHMPEQRQFYSHAPSSHQHFPTDVPPKSDVASHANGTDPSFRPSDHSNVDSSYHLDRDQHHVPARFLSGSFGTPMREEQTGLFRPAYPPTLDRARDSIEARQHHDRTHAPRAAPPTSDISHLERGRNGFADRPMTFEEHQRMDAIYRGHPFRKELDPVTHRSLLSISPELKRRGDGLGRNSPLPQAVHGAQPRHIGPGGDNPEIKMEFGRMFPGLGSGAGSIAHSAGQNGSTTPARMSPARFVDGNDLARTAAAEIEAERTGSRASKTGRKNGRRAREIDDERAIGREPPDSQQSKRAKTAHANHHHHHLVQHAHHHHHHHHHAEPDNRPSPFNMIRFPSSSSNPAVHANASVNPVAHRHHHHAHPVQHHHHHHPAQKAPVAIPAVRKPVVTVDSTKAIASVAHKPRRHLGSQLYTTDVGPASPRSYTVDSRVKYTAAMRPIPPFDATRENCTFTVRVPRWYLSSSSSAGIDSDSTGLEEICRRRQLWGSEVYTDDSDVVAAAIHDGWLRGDFGDANADLQYLMALDDDDDEPDRRDLTPITDRNDAPSARRPPGNPSAQTPRSLTSRPQHPISPPPSLDAHITVLILPPLETYASTLRHHLRSRRWGPAAPHDGRSFAVCRIDFVDESPTARGAERGIAARKSRLAADSALRREAARAWDGFGGRRLGGGQQNGSLHGEISARAR